MQSLPFTLTNEAVTVVIDGAPKIVRQGGALYAQLREALFEEDWDRAKELLAKPEGAVSAYIQAGGLTKFTADGTTIKWGDEVLPGDITKRVNAMAAAGEDPAGLLRFFERLQQNPSMRSVEQLFSFLQHNDIPIEPDGTFLAYKGLNQDMTDKHTGTIDNSPGQVHEMPRNKISDDPNHACHEGFHVGSLGYVRSFGQRTVVCRVAPEDVVCVPYDASSMKMRVCRYEVVGHWTGTPLSSTVTKPGEVDVDNTDDEAEEMEVEEALAQTTAPSDDSAPGSTPKRNYRSPVSGKTLKAMGKMDQRALLKQTIDALRAYAVRTLKIVGATRLPGGKLRLIKEIAKARKRS